MISDEIQSTIRFIKLFIRNSRRRKEKQYKQWIESGKPLPSPHIVKQKLIEEYARNYNKKTLVETGTFLGDMVYSQRNNFEKIISTELSSLLYNQTKKTLRNIKNVELLLGDSGKMLKKLIEKESLKQPCLFWLDGHYSGGETALGDKETPILDELTAILES